MTPQASTPQEPGRILVTGGSGFLGWHLRVRLRAVHGEAAEVVDRAILNDADALREVLANADVLVHLAGVNRAESDDAVEEGNLALARRIADAIAGRAAPLHVVYSNSIHADTDTSYGRGKRGAGDILRRAALASGGTMADVWLPNLFGEHGRPHYNSFVATFCAELAAGRHPQVLNDSSISLMHAQDAAAVLCSAIQDRADVTTRAAGSSRRVSEVLAALQRLGNVYAEGEVPDLTDKFTVDLFNTYRSFLFPRAFPSTVKVNSDNRGDLFECVRAHGPAGQTFMSTTGPGMTRGEHYHLSKVERFFVVQGEAEISLRRVLDNETVRFRLHGGDHAFVDMPTMWVHNIRNVGTDDLLTLFWSDQLYNPENPDTYPERVDQREGAVS